MRALCGIWWGAHPSALLLIYKSVIRGKLDYDSFLYGLIGQSNWKKLNSIQLGCLRLALDALCSSPARSIEIKSACSPLDLRCRCW